MKSPVEIIQIKQSQFEVIKSLQKNASAVETLLVKSCKSLSTKSLPSKNAQQCVLKRLTQANAHGFNSIAREAACLRNAAHPRIPRLYDAWIESPHQATLVMAYVPGYPLNKCIESNTVQPQRLYRWLEQACKLLCHIHAQGIIHQDITPNNFIVHRHRLHLIDFGGALGTRPYAAPELLYNTDDNNVSGQHTVQTDLYSLGRTFQHLLFGERWESATNRERKRLKETVDPKFAQLVEIVYWLTEEAPGDRPTSAAQVLSKLQNNKSTAQKFIDNRRWLPGAIALTTSALVMGLRLSGTLQPFELKAYDHIMATSAQLRPEPQDDRLVVITINKADYDYQKNHRDTEMIPENDDSISDAALNQLLSRLLTDAKNPPSVIGLDLRRDKAISARYPFLQQLFQQASESGALRLVCHIAGDSETAEPFGPPTDSDPNLNAVAFSDLLTAESSAEAGTIRRAVLAVGQQSELCPAYNSLALAAMTRYFVSNGATADWNSETWDFDVMQGDRITALPFLPSMLNIGGYRLPAAYSSENQVLINYRRRRNGPTDVAPTLSLTAVLKGQYAPDAFAGKVVLIGVDRTATSQKGDRHRVPYGGELVPGVFVHANIISQLIAHVEDDRQLIWALPQATGDRAIILCIAICASAIMLWIKITQRGTIYAICFGIGGILVVYILSLGAFVGLSLWLPLVPALLTWSITSASIFIVHKHEEENQYVY